MFGTPSTPAPFGTPSSAPLFGTPATPAFGTASSTPLFGTPSTPAFGATPAFGTPSSTSLFGTPSTPAFGAAPAFGTPSTPAFGTPSSTPAWGTSAFGTPSSTPAFGSQSTPAFGSPSFFQPQQQQQQQQQQGGFSLFPQQQPQQQLSLFPQQNAQITTQMAPVAPISMALADRDLTAIIEAYRDEAANPKYSFRHLLFSVTDQAARVKPVGVSDIMWAEAMSKLEGMRSSDRDRLWPQLVQGFKELSNRLQLQDEVIVSDAARLKTTQTNVKLLTRHLQTDAIPRGQRLKHTEQALQRRLLRVMRIVEALELKGFRLPLTKDEVELADKLVAILKKLKGPGGDVSRVHNLLAATRVHSNGGGIGSNNLSASANIDEQSLAELQDVLQQQTEAIARLGMILKRDIRDSKIIMPEGSDVLENGTSRQIS